VELRYAKFKTSKLGIDLVQKINPTSVLLGYLARDLLYMGTEAKKNRRELWGVRYRDQRKGSDVLKRRAYEKKNNLPKHKPKHRLRRNLDGKRGRIAGGKGSQVLVKGKLEGRKKKIARPSARRGEGTLLGSPSRQGSDSIKRKGKEDQQSKNKQTGRGMGKKYSRSRVKEFGMNREMGIGQRHFRGRGIERTGWQWAESFGAKKRKV